MNEDTKRDRSPNFPKLSLESAIELVKKLHSEIGKAKVKREVAISALGYSGASGASLTTLGALNQYALIDQDRGAGVSISALAISLLHPLNERQEREAKITAVLSPKVFNVLYTDGFHHASESTLANSLIQNGFTPEGARKAASVYLSNISFANLLDESIRGPSDAKKDQIRDSLESGKFTMHPVSREILESERGGENEAQTGKKMLAQYSVPIGEKNIFTVTITGEQAPASEDFEVLKKYADIWKMQFKPRAALGEPDQPIEATAQIESPEREKPPTYLPPPRRPLNP
jgi:hypothetical protein